MIYIHIHCPPLTWTHWPLAVRTHWSSVVCTHWLPRGTWSTHLYLHLGVLHLGVPHLDVLPALGPHPLLLLLLPRHAVVGVTLLGEDTIIRILSHLVLEPAHPAPVAVVIIHALSARSVVAVPPSSEYT